MKVDIKSLIILILIIVIVFLRNCQGEQIVFEEKVVYDEKIEYVEVEIEKEVYVPKYTERIITEIDTLLINNPIDTLEILRDYYTKYFYKDTLSLDSLGYVVLNDTITENKILNREFTSMIIIPEKTIEKTVYLNSRLFFMGPSISFYDQGLNTAQWDFYYKDRKNRLYNLGLGVNDRGKAVFNTGFKWEIN